MTRRIILLNGPSSSGKSTLARKLQAVIGSRRDQPYALVSIDDLLPMSPTEPIHEDDVFEINAALCARVWEALKTAPGVIVDHVITSERIFRQTQSLLGAYPLTLIRVICPLPLLRQREAARQDRCPGSAEASEKYLFPKEGYDLTVDTSRKTPAENALAIYEALCPAKKI